MIARRFRLLAMLVALPLLWSPVATASQATPPVATPHADSSCDVTLPNGEIPPGDASPDLAWYGSGAPDASLWLMMTWDDGVYSSQPSKYQAGNGHVTGHALKFAIFRGERSDVTLSATGADGMPIGDDRYLYPEYPTPVPGIDVFAVVVPSEGCWTLTAADGNDTITWTVLVTTAIDGCDITMPNGEAPPGETGGRWYGSGNSDVSLWVQLQTPPVQWFPAFEPRDNGGHSIKTPFWRGEGSGPITLTGERLDQPSTFEPHIDAAWDGYPIPGFIATGIWYPTEGCWQLTATDGNDTLTWTVLVQSPFTYCDVTSGADDDGTIPETVIPPSTRPVHPDDYYGENGLYITLGDAVR